MPRRRLSVVALPGALVLLLSLPLRLAGAFGGAHSYLVVSSPSTRTIAYVKLPSEGGPPSNTEPMRVLVGEGLSVPQGVAIDQYRQKLYVADPDLGKLVSYDLKHASGDALTADNQKTVAEGVEARWVTVDGLGNVYCTDEGKNRVLKISAENVMAGKTTAEVLFDGTSDTAVSGPGGIVADNYFAYWVNKISGTQAGSLIRGVTIPMNTSAVPSIMPLTKNSMKSYGVCLAMGNVFYTDDQKNMYFVRRTGGTPYTVTASLMEPRGCAFDNAGTVYVADKGLNAVYSLAASAEYYTLDTPLNKAADLKGAFGVAVYVSVMS